MVKQTVGYSHFPHLTQQPFNAEVKTSKKARSKSTKGPQKTKKKKEASESDSSQQESDGDDGERSESEEEQDENALAKKTDKAAANKGAVRMKAGMANECMISIHDKK